MSEKPIYVVKPSLPPFEEYVEEIKTIWEQKVLTNQGPKHKKLHKKLLEYLETENLLLFSNGHLSLELGLESLELKGEIITTPFTFVSTIQAIVRNGCKPVFCDINPDDFTIDCNQIESLITEKTCAILPVHVYGNICDVEKIEDIAKRHGLKVIYDGAHAFGETYQGKNVANFGDMTMFSFHATKVFNTVEGGALVYQDNSLTERLKGLRQFGQILGTEEVPFVGTNAKISEFHCAMGICNMNHLDEYIEKRKRIAERYTARLEGQPGIQLNNEQDDLKRNYAYYPVVFDEKEKGVSRDKIIEALEAKDIFPRKYFYPLCSDLEFMESEGKGTEVPVAHYVADRVLTLPIFSDMDLDDVDEICDVILSLYDC